jgi:hypothetical protein
MPTQAQIQQFVIQAKASGYSDQEIADFLRQKQETPSSVPAPTRTKTGLEKAGDILTSIFGGKKIGEAIGTKIAEIKTGQDFEGPSASQVAGDVASTGLGILGFKGAGTVGKFGARFFKTAALGAGIGAGRALENKGNIGTGAATGAAVASVFPVASGAFNLTKRFLSSMAKRAAASLSGVGSDAIETVVTNPTAARAAMRGDSSKTLTNLATQVRTMVSNLAREANEVYEESLEQLPKRLGRVPQVLTAGQKTTIKVGGTTYILSVRGVKASLTRKLREFGVIVNPRKKEFDFFESPFRSNEENILREVFQIVDNWKDTSPRGLNRLAIKIGNYRKAGEQSQALNSVIDAMKRNVRSYLGTRVPAAKQLNDRYAQVQDFIEALDQELSTDGAFLGGTAENIKTARKIATLFNKNKELARELVQRLEGGTDILATEVGRELSSGIARSTASIGDLLRSAIQTALPPRAIGEIAAQLGITQQQLAPILASLRELSPASRILLIQSLLRAFSPSENSPPSTRSDER